MASFYGPRFKGDCVTKHHRVQFRLQVQTNKISIHLCSHSNCVNNDQPHAGNNLVNSVLGAALVTMVTSHNTTKCVNCVVLCSLIPM